jgi:hypothetical protein
MGWFIATFLLIWGYLGLQDARMARETDVRLANPGRYIHHIHI